ncbi:MAG: UDP-N-acetylglucosamine 1-carboxyvinyltransferase [bacterium]|nr:UDP-N-acetylglucosamine 1-carboxyvinyltransferase [bacterium]
MKQIKIEGGKTLSGTIRISGAKNAAVALIPAAILADDDVTLCNIPEISDIDSLEEILKYLNVDVKRNTESMIINAKNMENKEIPEEIAKKLRASYYFMGALLARYKKVVMYFPGGCNIGKRPIDIHLEGFEKLGATVNAVGDKYEITAEKLVGTSLKLPVASVGATINLMIAATKAEGVTIISNAAKEPEIINVAELLNSMGAKISGAGTDTIKITGVENLSKGYSFVIPDRIEAGTYIIIGSLLGKNLKVDNIIPSHLKALTEKLLECGADIKIEQESIICNKNDNLKSNDIITYYYPGFPTDLQQPFSVLLTQCEGTSTIEEKIWENRFMHVPYLNKMGAKIKVADKKAIINGKTSLVGQEVVATDLRGGASMIVAGLIASGKTTINEVEHILRGYDEIIEKLSNVGAKIEIEEIK